jgi:hypothetical protein
MQQATYGPLRITAERAGQGTSRVCDGATRTVILLPASIPGDATGVSHRREPAPDVARIMGVPEAQIR